VGTNPLQTATLLVVGAGAALALLGVAIHLMERRAAPAGRAQRLSSAGPSGPRPARHAHLSYAELARLAAFRARAHLITGEPLVAPGLRAQLRHAWREGYAGWILACLAGAFSMATHFGAWWLISGGGWLGATLVTLGSTAVMLWTCAWIGLGLLNGR
jgi:hypothetical protein